MADIVNLDGSSGRSMIGDDSTPNLILENTSSGECLKLQNARGTGVQLSMVSCPTTSLHIVSAKAALDVSGLAEGAIKGGATGVNVVNISHTVLAGATVAPLSITQSVASGAMIEFNGVFMSTASINIAADKTVFVIPVYHGGIKVKGYIPVFMGVS